MSATQGHDRPVAGVEPGGELAARLEALHTCGAARFDAVGVRVIEAMLRRLDAFDGAARTALVRKIERRLAAVRDRFERAGGEAVFAAGRGRERGGPVQREGTGGPLAELLAHVARQAGTPLAPELAGGGAPAPLAELKALRHFRGSWSRLSLEQQLARALAQAPDNAGPLNSHYLALQALIRMSELAPQYLEAFVTHVDALLWLERADPGRGTAQRGAGQKGAARKADARSPRGRTRKADSGKAG